LNVDELKKKKSFKGYNKSVHNPKRNATFHDFKEYPKIRKLKSIIYIVLSILGVVYSISTFALSVMSYLDINKKPLALQHI